MELFDTHAHYYDDAFDADRDEVLSALPDARGASGWSAPAATCPPPGRAWPWRSGTPFSILPPGSTRKTWRGPALADLDEVRGLAAHPKCVAIGRDRPGLLLAENPGGAGQLPGLLRRPAGAGRGAGPARHRPRPGRPQGHPGPGARPPRHPGGIPLLRPLRRGRQGGGEAGLVRLLYRQRHLQKRPPGAGGHRRRPPGAHHDRDRQPPTWPPSPSGASGAIPAMSTGWPRPSPR